MNVFARIFRCSFVPVNRSNVSCMQVQWSSQWWRVGSSGMSQAEEKRKEVERGGNLRRDKQEREMNDSPAPRSDLSIRERSTLPLRGGKMLLQILESQKRRACHYKLSILQTRSDVVSSQPPVLTAILGNVVTQVSSSGAWVVGYWAHLWVRSLGKCPFSPTCSKDMEHAGAKQKHKVAAVLSIQTLLAPGTCTTR